MEVTAISTISRPGVAREYVSAMSNVPPPCIPSRVLQERTRSRLEQRRPGSSARLDDGEELDPTEDLSHPSRRHGRP